MKKILLVLCVLICLILGCDKKDTSSVRTDCWEFTMTTVTSVKEGSLPGYPQTKTVAQKQCGLTEDKVDELIRYLTKTTSSTVQGVAVTIRTTVVKRKLTQEESSMVGDDDPDPKIRKYQGVAYDYKQTEAGQSEIIFVDSLEFIYVPYKLDKSGAGNQKTINITPPKPIRAWTYKTADNKWVFLNLENSATMVKNDLYGSSDIKSYKFPTWTDTVWYRFESYSPKGPFPHVKVWAQ